MISGGHSSLVSSVDTASSSIEVADRWSLSLLGLFRKRTLMLR